QARALDALLADEGAALDAAIVISVPEEVSLKRITGRRSCVNCGRNYSLDEPPENNWTCDTCGGHVNTRADDLDEDAIRERLRAYHETTEPLKEYYAAKGILREIGGLGTPDEVFDRIVASV